MTELERAVVELQLLSAGVSTELVASLLKVLLVESREFTGVGFFTRFAKLSVPGLALGTSQLADVHADIPLLEHGAGFILFVENGRLDMLEGFCYDESWPSVTGEFKLRLINWESKNPNLLEENEGD